VSSAQTPDWEVEVGMPRRGRKNKVVAALAALGGVGLLLASVWTGVSYAAPPPPVTDYASDPPPLPATCPADGAGVLQNVQFSAGGQTASNLQALPIGGGTAVTMTWSGFTPGCEGLGIGLSLKYAQMPTFNPADDQVLHSFVYCGPGDPTAPCTAPYTLTLTMPTAAVVPCGQLDAHIGPPLAVVGPSGAFYNLGNSQNMLISAWNGGTEPCDYEVCATNPSLPAGSVLCTSTPTAPPTSPTTPSSAPPTSPPSSTASTAPPSTPTSATAATVLGTRVSAAPAAVGGTVATTIPATGSETRPWAMVAGLLLLAGAPLALIFRRREGRHFAA
jgi:LPXTG-motif cell wall-anchored protein